MTLDDIDKVGLVREAYRIEGISLAECRSIFVDWALRLPTEIAPPDAIRVLLDTYAAAGEQHPMTQVLSEGLSDAVAPKRRGGRKARVG